MELPNKKNISHRGERSAYWNSTKIIVGNKFCSALRFSFFACVSSMSLSYPVNMKKATPQQLWSKYHFNLNNWLKTISSRVYIFFCLDGTSNSTTTNNKMPKSTTWNSHEILYQWIFFLSRIPKNWKKVDDMHFLLTPEHFFLLLFVLEIWRYIFVTLWKYFCFIMFILFWHSVMGCSRRVRSGDGLWWVGYQLRHKINKTFNNNNNCILQFDEKRGRPHKTNLSTLSEILGIFYLSCYQKHPYI